MMKLDNNLQAFFAVVRAGLWADAESTDSRNFGFVESVDWVDIYRLAEEQSVIGVVLAGIERLRNDDTNLSVPQKLLLQWIGEVQMLEQQNKAMNKFIAGLIERLRKADIYSLLVKGQGIALCYERPLWRACGDVDLLLSEDNYNKAITYLTPLCSNKEREYHYNKHQGFTIDSWVVELHGSLRGALSSRIDKVLDKIKDEIIYEGHVRTWINGKTQVFLPSVNSNVIYVFSHVLTHFYKGGLGLRQVCDLCRLLWNYRTDLDLQLLESRIRRMGLLSEWKTFSAFAVDYLGMPTEAMPFYSTDKKWKKKADRICSFILEVGNMGHNRDTSYFEKYPYLIRKVYSMGRRCGDLFRHARIFPLNSLRFFPRIMFNGLRSTLRGE